MGDLSEGPIRAAASSGSLRRREEAEAEAAADVLPGGHCAGAGQGLGLQLFFWQPNSLGVPVAEQPS